ncbi:hypothetical protein [Microbacterium sp. p3-SID336]|uniref:hypothetical protein n=1 Tax=Microbacterium sp. p3-SID336 TaxID=2916212 RepID=UPI0021A47785|nr:hypothetical protein [Microbacterium sp. p3-SID336]MCT1476546.1 hypothetical protein [Microbacterium sp. p3-SID336]
MRKTSAVLASLSLAALALTGCSVTASSADASCDRSGHDNGIGEAVSVEGEVGSMPEVDIYAPLRLTETSYTDVVTGDGRAVVDSTQPIIAQLSIYSGETGEQVFTTSYDADNTRASSIDSWAAQAPGLKEVLECATAGTRVVAGLTPEDFGENNLKGFGMAEDDTAVFVVDVVDAFHSRAEGSLQFNDAQGMPTVVRAPDGTPGVIIPDGPAPEEQVVQTLILGDGEKVTKDDAPLVHFTAVDWEDKSVLQSSWGQQATDQMAQIAAPVAEALVGRPVGSQVLVVLPKTENSAAMAIVVDILGIAPASSSAP